MLLRSFFKKLSGVFEHFAIVRLASADNQCRIEWRQTAAFIKLFKVFCGNNNIFRKELQGVCCFVYIPALEVVASFASLFANCL